MSTRSGTTLACRYDSRVLVIGLGNELLSDDGVGIHIVRDLQRNPPDGALVVEVGTALLDALHLLERARRVVAIDAMEAGGAPGSVYMLTAADVADRVNPASLHELDLKAAMRLLPGCQMPEIVVVGVEPARIEFGLDLSPQVASALPQTVALVRSVVSEWRTMRARPTARRFASLIAERAGAAG